MAARVSRSPAQHSLFEAAPPGLRFREERRRAGGFERFSMDAPPRSAYLLDGEIRHEWEHSITPMRQRRYSITFRSLRPARG